MGNYLCIPVFRLGQLEGETGIQVSVSLCPCVRSHDVALGVASTCYVCVCARAHVYIGEIQCERHAIARNQFRNKKGGDEEDHI